MEFGNNTQICAVPAQCYPSDPTGFFRSRHFRKIGYKAYRFWSFAKDARALIICGEDEEVASDHWISQMAKLWEFYRSENPTNDLSRRINKVMYARMTVRSGLFRSPAVLHVGFQTTLYRSTLILKTGEIFTYDADDHSDRLPICDYAELELKVTRPDSYCLSAADLSKMNENEASDDPGAETGSYNVVADHFATKNCPHLEYSQLTLLTQNDSFRNFGLTAAVRKLVNKMINRYVSFYVIILKLRIVISESPTVFNDEKSGMELNLFLVFNLVIHEQATQYHRIILFFHRYDPGNKEALSLFNEGDVIGCAKKTHPLVSVLLHAFVKFANENFREPNHDFDAFVNYWSNLTGGKLW